MQNIIKIEVDNSAGIATIDIEGIIGTPDFSDSGKIATYEAFKDRLTEVRNLNVRKIVVNIRSIGGDVQDALLIYDALKAIDRKVETICYGYTASAATIIAQAASAGERKMSANGLYLIHQASTHAEGNASELEAQTELLKKTDERIVAIYAIASGRDAAEFAELMAANNGSGKWLSAEEALSYGLIDQIINAATISNEYKPEEVGLPALPKNDVKMSEKTTVFDRFKAWFEETMAQDTINTKEAEVTNLTAERDAAIANLATVEAERDTLKAQLADKEVEVLNLQTQLAEAKAMAVKATEPAQQVNDPDPQPIQMPKSANEKAYAADLAAFK